MDELEKLKHEIYRRAKVGDYMTFGQFCRGDKIAMTREEKMSIKNTKKDLKKK